MTIASALTRLRVRLLDATRLVGSGRSPQSRAGLVVACMFSLSAVTQAQTAAHFGGVTTTLGGVFVEAEGVAVDAAGNVFVADTQNNLVKEILAVDGVIPPSPTILTLGGGFNNPQGVAVDRNGNVFVADTINGVVKEIPAGGGPVRTVGSGFVSPHGVAVDANGNVFTADQSSGLIQEMLAVGGVLPLTPTIVTLAANFTFGSPYGVAVDRSGNVFVADDAATQVYEIVAVGGSIPSSNPTVNTLGSGWGDPFGVAVDASGNVYVADNASGRIVKLPAAGGYTSMIQSDGYFLQAGGVAVDRNGNLVIVGDHTGSPVFEYQLNTVNLAPQNVGGASPTVTLPFVFDAGGTIGIPAVLTQGAPGLDFADAGTGTCTTNGTSYTYNPGDICTVDVTFTPTASGIRYGAVRLSDSSAVPIATGLVYGTGLGGQVAFTPGIITTIAGNGSSVASGLGGPALSAGLSVLIGVRTDEKGNVYIAESGANRILKIDATTNLVTSIAGTGTAGFAGDGGLATSAQLNYPNDLAIDGAGNIYIADQRNQRIRKIDGATGIITTIAGTGSANDTGDGGPATAAAIFQPYTVVVDGLGNVYIGGGGVLVRRIDAASGIITTFAGSTFGYSGDGGPATAAQLEATYYLALDVLGNVYIADGGSSTVRKVDASTGIITTVAGNGQYGFSGDGGPATSAMFSEPYGLALDSSNNIYIADADNNRVRKVDVSTGIVTTIVGNGAAGFSGDGGPATSAQMNYVDGLAIDGAGNLYISDYSSHRIRKVTTGTTALAFASTAVGATSGDSPKTVSLSNIGNAALTFPPPSTGLNPSISTGFTYGNSSTCPQISSISSAATLGAGASCTELISFTPTVAGSISGSVVITDDALNVTGPAYTTQSILLSGTATASLTASTAVALTVLTQGHAATAFTPVTASGGTGTLTYSISPALPAGLAFSSLNGTVSGTPTAVSAATTYTVTVTDTTSATATDIFSLTVNPAVTGISPGSANAVDFGMANVCPTGGNHPAPCSQTETVYFNVQGSVTPIANLRAKVVTQGVANLDFTTGPVSCTPAVNLANITSNTSCQITVSFAPLAPGVRLGAIDMIADGGLDATVFIHGIGIAPQGVLESGTLTTLPIPFVVANGDQAWGVVADPAGNIYATDKYNCHLYRYTASTQTAAIIAGTAACTGSDGPLASADFDAPRYLALDGRGNLYISDTGTIRKVDALTGNATTIFGNNSLSYAYTTDGHLALGSTSGAIRGLAIDTSGSIYFADTTFATIRKIDVRSGILSTVVAAGGNQKGYYGEGVPALTAYIEQPEALAFNAAGDLFFADSDNNLIRKVDATTGLITTVAGTIPASPTYVPTVQTANRGYSGDGSAAISAKFNDAEALAIDPAGNLYIGDSGNNVVRKVNATTHVITTISGINGGQPNNSGTLPYPGEGLPANQAPLGYMEAIALDAQGNLLISDYDNAAIRRVSAASTAITFSPSLTVGTSSTATDIRFSNIGNASLNLSTLTNPADFNVQGQHTDCSTSTPLASAGTCTFGFEFLPTTVGPLSETFTATDDSLNLPTSTITVTELGTGLAVVATKLLFIPATVATLAPGGNLGMLTVNIAGSSGVVATTATNTVSISITGPGGFTAGPFSGVVSNGVATFSVGSTLLPTAGAYVVTATSSPVLTPALLNVTVFSPVVASTAIASETLTQGHSGSTFTPVTASGGTGTLTYSVSPVLPAGLSFSSSTGAVSGTATAVSAATTYTVTVTDTNGAASTATFSLTVNSAIGATTATPSTVLTQGHAAAAFTPVTASGGTGTLTYSVSPVLPAGLSFSTTGAVSGTATAVSAATTYTVTVTDTNGAASTATFSLTVNSAIGATTATPSTVLTQGHAATAFTPVTASGGTGTLTYSVSPALPAGLSFSSSTGAVSGTATAVSAATTYTVTVTDTNGAASTATFSLTVNSAIGATTATPSTVLTQGHAATAFTPVTASGGTGTLTYSVSPVLPAGLSFSSSTGAVSGTATAVSAATTYTVTVTDTNGAASTATFSLTVNSAIGATTATPSTVLTQGHAAAAFTPVTASGGTGTLTYSVSPVLPAGLSFSSSTGAVSGTATAVSAATTYTVTVTDTNGAASTATFSLTVNSAVTTSTVIAASSLTPTYGTPVVLTAKVTPAPADTPSGTVSFYTGTTLLGTVALNSTGVTTLSIALPLGSNALTAAYSGSASYAGSTSSALSVSDRTGTSVMFSASPTTQLYNNPIVLTAQATSPTAGTLTGTVSFLDGTTVIATVPLGANGQATYSVTTLADGSHSLTAAYSGDQSFQPSGSTGAAVAITIGDVNLNLGGDQNQSVVPGAAVAYSFPLSPLVTPTFLYDVHLTATGLPPGATYTFSPAMIPAGSASLPVTLTVQTSKGTASLSLPAGPGQQNSSRGIAALAFGLLLPLLGAKPVRKRFKAMPRPLAMFLFAVFSLGAMVGMTGCGGGGFYGATATSGKYTITVTATSADLVRVSTVQLTIQ